MWNRLFTLTAAVSLLICIGILAEYALARERLSHLPPISSLSPYADPQSIDIVQIHLRLFGVGFEPMPAVFLTSILPICWLAQFLWRRLRPRPSHGVCHRCGYNLTGNVSGACPDCGAAVLGDQRAK